MMRRTHTHTSLSRHTLEGARLRPADPHRGSQQSAQRGRQQATSAESSHCWPRRDRRKLMGQSCRSGAPLHDRCESEAD